MTDSALPEKPRKVINALRVLYVYLAIAGGVWLLLVTGIIELNSGDRGIVVLVCLGLFYVVGYSAGFLLEIRKGKNWARITFVVLFYLFLGGHVSTSNAS